MNATTTSTASAAARRDAGIWAAFAVLVLAMLPAVLDQTILATALPTIARQLGTLGDVSYLVTAYVLASTVATPLWGKLGDRHGRRSLLGIALTLFLAASATCGVAQTLGQLIAARAVQGVAAGGLMALAMASVGDLVDPRERPRWQGRIAAAFSVAAVAGPLVGGLLVQHASWRWVFYVTLPIGLVALAGIARKLPAGTRDAERRPLDMTGATLLAAASGAALLIPEPRRAPTRLGLGGRVRLGRRRSGRNGRVCVARAPRTRPDRSAGNARLARRSRRIDRHVPRDRRAVRCHGLHPGAAAGIRRGLADERGFAPGFDDDRPDVR